jgi:xanthine dehydrogenase accessory factor
MTGGWIRGILDAELAMPLIRAVVINTEGSTPREVGAAMIVTVEDCLGTVGGGALEHEVIGHARMLLGKPCTEPWSRDVLRYHLGPELNQCCGGVVTVLLEKFGHCEIAELRKIGRPTTSQRHATRPLVAGVPVRLEDADGCVARLHFKDGKQWFVEPLDGDATALLIYGAGHVGRALVKAMDGLPFRIFWGDVAPDRFPIAVRQGVTVLAGDLVRFARSAACGAFHVVMTRCHALDEDIVRALIEADSFNYLGLIGSETKAARFRHRLVRADFNRAAVDKLHSPIGLAGLYGKEPTVLAASVAADLLMRRQNLTTRVANSFAVRD